MGVLRGPGKEWKPVADALDQHEIQAVRLAILDKYGFEPSDLYCADLIAFVVRLLQEPSDGA